MTTAHTRPGPQLVRLDQAQAERFRSGLLTEAGLPPELRAEMIALIARRTVSTTAWRFVMVHPQRDFEIVQWIARNARRTPTSHLLWSVIKGNLHSGTNQVLMSRAQMMQATGASSAHVSEALSEFARIDVLQRHKEGREVRWFLNPRIATHQSGAARDDAQRIAPHPLACSDSAKP
jgi:CRP-like cAMP-binding protein